MSEASDTRQQALDLSTRLRDVIDETERDFASMPFFVRPMVRRGLAKRTGKSIAEWQRFAATLMRRVDSSGGAFTRAQLLAGEPDPMQYLERLAEHYRTAPERAALGMGRNEAALQVVKERSRAREEVVRALIRCLASL